MTVILQAVERAVSGNGRARIHSSQLEALGIADLENIEVVSATGACMTLIAFADSHISSDQIRMSGDDLKKLGIPGGGRVTVQRRIPISEQIKSGSRRMYHRINSRLLSGIPQVREQEDT